MAGYSPFLPLTTDPVDGILLTKSYAEVAKQNFKMLLLTVPGERIMDPLFGIGLKTYFFENITPSVIASIKSRITEQTAKYLPYINFLQLDINSDVTKTSDVNSLTILLKYEIRKLNVIDVIKVDFDLNPDLL
jgi:phage baseplate assembly protein W